MSPSVAHRLDADLHCHSRVSDGTLEPGDVARRAQRQGVALWALTDHDEVAGQDEAHSAARQLGMRYVSGVEISVTWAARTLHIVGLNFDHRNPKLVDGLARTRGSRDRRAREMSDELASVGIDGCYEGALSLAGNPEMVARTHFARFMVDQGVCPDVKSVFAQYLVEGKPGYIPMNWGTLGNAISWIRDAGGVAIVAHPGRYKLTEVERDALFAEFVELGGNAVEVVSGSHTPDDFRFYAEIARHYGLRASRGSDFHAPGEGNAEFGSLPPLPESVVPVWTDWI